MPQPDAYNRQYNFQNFTSLTPTAQQPGDKLDLEYNSIKITIDQILARLVLIQEDDGTLKRNSVGTAQISPAVSLGFAPPVAWATNTNFSVDKTAFFEAKLYICKIAHLSGNFANDLAAGKWSLLADFGAAVGSAVNTSFTPAGTIAATNVQAAIAELDSETQTALAAKAPNTADFVVATADAGLTAERVATSTTTISVDTATAGQMKWNVPAGGIDTAQLANNAVSTIKIADAQVTALKLATDSVETAKIAALAVTAAKLADDAVTTAKILNANVTTAKIADLNVTTVKIADNAITYDKLASGLPTIQRLTSGTAATYTTPAGVKRIVVRMIGGGGGGGGATSGGTAGGAGGTTSFESWGAGGGGGGATVTGEPGAGGSGGTTGTGTLIRRVTGARGGQIAQPYGGGGGSSQFALMAPTGRNSQAGDNGPANTGAGGGGGSNGVNSGSGGGAGEYVEFFINTPAATYTYTIGAAGTAGAAGGAPGGAGGSGVIEVYESYR